MSYGGQQGSGGYGQEETDGDYGMEEQYDQYDEAQGEEEDGQDGPQMGQQQVKGQEKGQTAHRFPHPDIAAQYYAKATAGNSQSQGPKKGAMSNNTADGSNQYSMEEEEQWGYEEHGNMQMQQRGKGRPLGGNYEDDQHHHAVMQGMEGLYNQGWTEEHKKSAAHIAGYALGWIGKWAGFY